MADLHKTCINTECSANVYILYFYLLTTDGEFSSVILNSDLFFIIVYRMSINHLRNWNVQTEYLRTIQYCKLIQYRGGKTQVHRPPCSDNTFNLTLANISRQQQTKHIKTLNQCKNIQCGKLKTKIKTPHVLCVRVWGLII